MSFGKVGNAACTKQITLITLPESLDRSKKDESDVSAHTKKEKLWLERNAIISMVCPSLIADIMCKHLFVQNHKLFINKY